MVVQQLPSQLHSVTPAYLFCVIVPSYRGCKGNPCNISRYVLLLDSKSLLLSRCSQGTHCCALVQDRKLNTEEGYTTQKYYTPTTSDLAVRTIRNWLENMASPVPWPSNAPADMHIRDIPREELLNRYHQHTKHCKNCSQVRSEPVSPNVSTRSCPLSMSQCRVEICWVSFMLIASSAVLPPLDCEALICAAI